MDALVAELETLHSHLRTTQAYRDSEAKPSLLLDAVEKNALTQVMSYYRGDALSTLAAVSPCARLCSEIASNGRRRTNLHIPLNCDAFLHELQYNFKALQPVSNISWWLERCPLSIRAKDADALNELLTASPAVHEKLKSLYIGKREMNTSVPVNVLHQLEELSVSGDAALLRAVDASQLTELRTLRLYKCAEDTYAILCRIPSLQSLFIEGLEMSTPSMHEMAFAKSLVQLTVTTSTLGSINGFEVCANLHHVRFHYCSGMEALSSLAAAPHLWTITGQSIGVHQLRGLAMCPELEVLELSSCKSLRRLSSLSGATHLKRISVQGSDVDDISGLAACLLLETINLSGCAHLTSLSPLSGAPRIRHIYAAGTGVRDVSGLASCPLLEVLDVSYCENLSSLACLAECPHLKQLLAAGSGVSVIDGLATCPELTSVDFTGCYNLSSLSALAGAPKLAKVVAPRSAVNNIDNIGKCPELESVDLKYCKNLQSLAPLVGAPKLGLIIAARKSLTNAMCPEELLPLIKEKA
ncbi:hypothetical protein ABB37_04553 [Leptomonas pyrrhocoris]|uniref:Leucine-rich repeat protein (LRRP) n=1 Tax=Leptomonas pyrrhocoris TaxID=157538 RepID=A0A0N0VF77_LEPPY|nr:hypothetical protein ABB37_04553 [Leptomonas pyrrhocoris]KPA80252.1 hypothetical protein ABB37_04553 [Leptomonas pyrrhocoris]|eukprot:XP_015658691.1 hypothetical protein ABB37_04553 [Leptomonas pyrrhocoris]